MKKLKEENMKAVVQRVTQSSVKIDGKIVSKIEQGFNVLLGIDENDTIKDADYLVRKISKLRIFEDDEEKLNLSLKDVGGEVLVVSQFTLIAQTKKGNRPSFINAAKEDKAIPLYEYFVKELSNQGLVVKTGEFGADMEVNIVNDGPVTILFDTNNMG